ncbi:twin-arginine translocase subunit TatC [bacterium]|nr:twin-arginine translocase subunit TatC [bacterium]
MLLHIIELRRRLIYIFAHFIILFVLFFYLAPHLFHILISPLSNTLPLHYSLIATQVTTPLFMPIKLAINAATICTVPFALFHCWCFVSPGLYQHERTYFRWLTFGSITLFCIGCLFCFFIILPFMFQLVLRTMPVDVRLMPDMGTTTDFITHMLLIFGLCFQVPLICLLLVHLRLLNIATLKAIRPYMIVAAFIIGMLLTPPDVLSQLMLAIPLCLLYEIGIFIAGASPKA